MPPISPPPPVATSTCVSSGASCSNSRADRALPGQHVRMVVGVHLQRAGLRLAGARGGQRLGIGLAGLHHARAIAGDARHLRGRRQARARRSPPAPPGRARHRRPPRRGCRRTRRSRRQPAARSDSSRLNAPRGLKLPVCCSSSSFRATGQDTPSSAPARRRTGVWRTWLAMRLAAAAMSARLTMTPTLARRPAADKVANHTVPRGARGTAVRSLTRPG